MGDTILIKNGHVVDPYQNINQVEQVVIDGNKIGAAAEKYTRGIDASGYYVFPGLIDFHCHFFLGSAFGVSNDFFLPTGVTVAVDAGSSGWINFEEFYRNTLSNSTLFTKAFLNISGPGQVGGGLVEPLDSSAMNWDKEEYLLNKYPDKILGVKVRISKEIVKENGIRPFYAAAEFAHAHHIPFNTHVTNPVEDPDKLLPSFQKGDIFTHVYHGVGMTILDETGHVRKEAWEAKERGVLFDAANGRKNFNFAVATKALADEFYPDIISTDATINTFSGTGTVKNLPFVMSKYLNMGISLFDVVKATTQTPAAAMKEEGRLGTLSQGAWANVTICKLVDHPTTFMDSQKNTMKGNKILVPVMVILRGQVVYCSPDFD